MRVKQGPFGEEGTTGEGDGRDYDLSTLYACVKIE
jgi:hypothetical protein